MNFAVGSGANRIFGDVHAGEDTASYILEAEF
jgi:hypothetical protein